MSRVIKVQHVYFIADARRTCVKIGIASDPERRLLDLQAGNHTRLRLELALNFTEPCSAGVYEDALHQMFAEHWRHREWFTYAPEIKAYVAAWLEGEEPHTTWPRRSCKRAAREHGVGVRKEDLMKMLRAKAKLGR